MKWKNIKTQLIKIFKIIQRKKNYKYKLHQENFRNGKYHYGSY